MGYTNYHETKREITKKEWHKITQMTHAIIGVAATESLMAILHGTTSKGLLPEKPILIGGECGEGNPNITINTIMLNGWDQVDESYETFHLERVPNYGAMFCKTNRKPYDAVCIAILLAAQGIAPDAILFSSDGDNELDWLTAGTALLDMAASTLEPTKTKPKTKSHLPETYSMFDQRNYSR